MVLVSLSCNRDFTSASSYGLGWYKNAIATQWYQFNTTDAWWFSLSTTLKDIGTSDQYHTNLTRHRIARTLCMLSGMFSHDADKTSYCKISQSLEAARFVFRIVRSLWNLTDTSAALLPTSLSNFRAIRKFNQPISRIRDFTRSYDKTSYRILKRRDSCEDTIDIITALGFQL